MTFFSEFIAELNSTGLILAFVSSLFSALLTDKITFKHSIVTIFIGTLFGGYVPQILIYLKIHKVFISPLTLFSGIFSVKLFIWLNENADNIIPKIIKKYISKWEQR